MKKKTERILAAILTGLLLFGQCVYAQEGTFEQSALKDEKSVDFTEDFYYPCDWKVPEDLEVPASMAEDPQIWAAAEQEDYAGDHAELLLLLEQKLKDAILAGETSVDLADMHIRKEQYPDLWMQYFSPYIVEGITLERYSLGGYYFKISINNQLSIEETEAAFQRIDDEIKKITGLVDDTMSEEEKALVIHDYFDMQYEYETMDESGSFPDAAYCPGGLFLRGSGVCNAYCYGYRYILTLLGIESHIVTSDSMNHAWNIIKIDGSYYHVDCTWDDPVSDRIGRVLHKNFLLSDDKIQEQKHYDWNVKYYPKEIICSNKKYDDAYWVEVQSPVLIQDGYAYYVQGNELSKRNLKTQGVQMLKDLGRWNVWQQESYYKGAFSGLFLFNGELYYNTALEIRKISTEGTNDTLVYKPNTDAGYVYGIRKHGNTLQYCLAQIATEQLQVLTAPTDLSIHPARIVLAPAMLQLKIGESAGITYSLFPEDSSAEVTWSSDALGVAVVSDQGIVTAVSAGTAKITAKTDNGETAVCEVTVAKRPEISEAEVTLSQESYIYDGQEKCPEVAVELENVILKENIDYTVAYSNNTNVGTAEVTVTGIGDYEGLATKNFAITARTIEAGNVTVSAEELTYDGQEKCPSVTVKDGNVTLKEDVDYTVTYSDNINAGTQARATIVGKGNYAGTINKPFGIKARSISVSGISLSQDSYVYDGQEKCPAVTVKDGNVTLVKDKDYTVLYSNNINVGTAQAVITGMGNYTGTISAGFEIISGNTPLPPAPTVPFIDVGKDEWFYDSVNYVYKENLMKGLQETVFGPDQNLARAQFCVILHRINDEPQMAYTPKFPDVPAGIWYTNAVLWANNIEVVTGYSNTGCFGPADYINREQMAVMMYRYAKYCEYNTEEKADFSKFADSSKVSGFAKEAMRWAVGTGIITGKDNGKKLDPQGNASRAECATIIMRFVKKYSQK